MLLLPKGSVLKTAGGIVIMLSSATLWKTQWRENVIFTAKCLRRIFNSRSWKAIDPCVIKLTCSVGELRPKLTLLVVLAPRNAAFNTFACKCREPSTLARSPLFSKPIPEPLTTSDWSLAGGWKRLTGLLEQLFSCKRLCNSLWNFFWQKTQQYFLLAPPEWLRSWCVRRFSML